MLVRVVGREWNSGVPGGTKIFRRPHIGFAGPGLTIGGRGAAKIHFKIPENPSKNPKIALHIPNLKTNQKI